MNLLTFLKRKPTPVRAETKVSLKRYECDMSKTHAMAALLKIGREQRDTNWYNHFYGNVAMAGFACGSPQTLTGPDGFTYFILKTPEPGQTFEAYCIQHMKDDFLLERGWGVVFNPAADGSAEWVFTYGNIVNLHLTNCFTSVIDDRDVENISFTKTVGLSTKNEQILVAQPSEEYLPGSTRAALKRFLVSKGIKKPKVMLFTSQNGGKVVRKLAFNIAPENYPVAAQLDHLMQQVGWFLPNDYILVPLSKRSELANGFNDM